MKQHTFIKDLPISRSGASQKLWCVRNAGRQYHVVTSAVDAMFSGPETYVFKADAEGLITSWSELKGSFRGALDHYRAIIAHCEEATA